ncbi:hypothetical protein [Beijerinckia sp. L45]|uniref:hypothetical protein n=1 Tax=Beijerinckia sp. L45 TaxID=1641855 RepID=UPI00131D9653|nr:hypothetical protein [Beijerinckia sp. L45]
MRFAALNNARALACAALALALATGHATAEPSAARVFSSLCTGADGSDISGFRIKVSGVAPNLLVSFEETEGALMAASETKEVSFTPATGELAFKVVTEAGPIVFKGRVSATALDGILTRQGDTPETVHLPSDAGGDGEGACPITPDSPKP